MMRMVDLGIGEPVRKVDNGIKTSGRAKYTADIHFDGMLYAKTVRSSCPRANIKNLAIPTLPEGYFVVTADDIPGKNSIKFLLDDWPFLAKDKVNYVGEAILLLVGPNRARLQELAEAIRITYEEVPAILTIKDTLSSGFTPIFGRDNKFAAYTYEKGNVKKAFADANTIIKERYSTGYQKQAYLENQGMIAVLEGDGKISVYGSLQCPYYVKNALVQALGSNGAKVRVVQMTTGGGFGGKEDYPSLLAGHAVFAALKTQKPVAVLYEREEDTAYTPRRHPAEIILETALDDKGNILGMKADIKLNGGAYAGISEVVLQRSIYNICGVYAIENLKVSGAVVATNTVPNGAFRGFGAPQVIFAIEMHMESLAKAFAVDELAYKQKYMAKQRDRTATNGLFYDEIKLPEMIKKAQGISQYQTKRAFYRAHPELHKGIGIALFLHGCGFTGSGERNIIKAKIKLCKKKDSSRVEILASNVDMGQGLQTTFRKIVAKALGIPLEDVDFPYPDTDRVPDSGPTVASRSIMIVGRMLQKAAEKLRRNWYDDCDIEIMQDYEPPERIKWDGKSSQGDAYPAYSWGVNIVEIAVDPLTYMTDVLGIWTVFDVGQAIDERIIEGQIQGGVIQGLGYAAMEVMTNDAKGKSRQNNLTNYTIPTAMDFAPIENQLVKTHYEDGPFGAKGAGELTLLGAAPAYASAVSQAMNIHITKLPVTPEDIMKETDHERDKI
ncbi:MAG: xanthine dehydrogenase family protein molybdopterin-binding subunit [Selenomonadaceae bacterium]